MYMSAKFWLACSSGSAKSLQYDRTILTYLHSFSQPIHQYIDRADRSRHNKMFQMFVWDCHVLLSEALHIMSVLNIYGKMCTGVCCNHLQRHLGLWRVREFLIHAMMFCLHYCFQPRINKCLESIQEAWNHHTLSTERNATAYQLYIAGFIAAEQARQLPDPSMYMHQQHLPQPSDHVVPRSRFTHVVD